MELETKPSTVPGTRRQVLCARCGAPTEVSPRYIGTAMAVRHGIHCPECVALRQDARRRLLSGTIVDVDRERTGHAAALGMTPRSMQRTEALGLAKLYKLLVPEAQALGVPVHRRSPEWEQAATEWLGDQPVTPVADPRAEDAEATRLAGDCIREFLAVADAYDADGQADIAGQIRAEVDAFRVSLHLRPA